MGELIEWQEEAETIQKFLKITNTTSAINETLKKLRREMRRVNVHNATKLLTDNTKIDSLSLIEKRLQQLKQKYPPRGNANPEVLLLDKPGEVYPIKFKRKCKTGKLAGSGLDT